jgi:hypothetical protein
MAFEKNDKRINRAGRPKGAVNRSTEMVKLSIARAVDSTLSTLSKDLEEIKKKDPQAALELAFKLLEYTIPKLSRTEVKAEVEQRIQQITVNIQQSGSNERIDD